MASQKSCVKISLVFLVFVLQFLSCLASYDVDDDTSIHQASHQLFKIEGKVSVSDSKLKGGKLEKGRVQFSGRRSQGNKIIVNNNTIAY